MAAQRARMDELGKLVLRLTVGGLMLLHGVSKVLHGVAGIKRDLVAHHVPGFVAYGVYVGEVVAPLLIIAGLFTRPAAAVVAFNMIVAVLMRHSGDVTQLARSGGWKIEIQAFYFFAAIALVLTGSGRYAVSRGKGRWD